MPRQNVALLETIHLRLARIGTGGLPELITDAIRSDETEVSVFRHTRIDTDLLVVLHPRSGGTAGLEAPSDFGLRLVSRLRDHGIVDHSVWTRFQGGAP